MIEVYDTNNKNPEVIEVIRLDKLVDKCITPPYVYFSLMYKDSSNQKGFTIFSLGNSENYLSINGRKFKYKDMIEKEGLIDALLTQEETLETLNKLP